LAPASPNPEGFRRLAATLSCSTDETLFVGDEEKDMSGALAPECPRSYSGRVRTKLPQWVQQHTIGELGALCPILCLVEEGERHGRPLRRWVHRRVHC